MSTYKCSQCGSGDIVTAFTAHVPLSVGDDANEDVLLTTSSRMVLGMSQCVVDVLPTI